MVTTYNQVGESTPFTVTYLPELQCTYVNITLCNTHTTYFLTVCVEIRILLVYYYLSTDISHDVDVCM